MSLGGGGGEAGNVDLHEVDLREVDLHQVDLRQVDVDDDAALHEWWQAFDASARHGLTAPFVMGYDHLVARVRRPGKHWQRTVLGAYDGASLVGCALVALPQVQNRDGAEVDIQVGVAYRRRGIGTSLLRAAREVCRQAGRTSMLDEIELAPGVDPGVDPGSCFAAAFGLVSKHVEDHLVRELPLGDAEVAAAVDRGKERRAGYSWVSWVGVTPPERVEQYADLLTRMSADVPTGEVDWEPLVFDAERVRANDESRAATGITQVVTFAIGPDGSPAGYSLIFHFADLPREAMQDDTMVLSAHRGRGIGLALKGTNTALAQRTYSGLALLHTWTAQSNGAMQRVNSRFGFRVVGTMHEYQGPLPTLS